MKDYFKTHMAYGIQSNILEWIKPFLSGRKQTVVVNGIKSITSVVLSGVPQDSVMGLLLFLIYINDVVSVVKSGFSIIVRG